MGTKSAKKAHRVSLRRRARNRPVRSSLKTYTTKAEKLIQGQELDSAPGAVTQAISTLDRAVGKGVIHPNNAARRKSRLLKKLHQAQQALDATPSPQPAS